MGGSPNVVGYVRGLAGGIVGGIVGYYAFIWLYRQGFYALILPGTMVGLGFGVASGMRSHVGGILCGLFGVALGIYTEWRWFPFADDQSLSFFLAHLHRLRPMTIMLILLGGACSYWLGLGRGCSVCDERTRSGPDRGGPT